MRLSPLVALSVALAAIVLLPDRSAAQSFRWGGAEFNALRKVNIPSEEKYEIVATQFFHHGEIAPDGKNVIVLTQDNKPVATRVLQLGPGDYCRLAFQTLDLQRKYEVYYGGPPPAEDRLPEWTTTAGLLLETREYRECNLNSLGSVRDAFESSKRIGSDYVANVHQSYNPFSLEPGPFLSYYSGYLDILKAGTYGFLTSSEDCSFLLIDGTLVVDAPGRHRPQRRARTGARKDIQLAAGEHKFEYYHAATGIEALMVAAWEVSPKSEKPAPTAIPSEVFRANLVGRVEAEGLTTRTEKLVPDFLVGIGGDVPLPDNDEALIGVKFVDTSPKALTLKSKITWEFGDGQTADVPDPVHVYLHSGIYPVTLSVNRGGRTFSMTNRIYIDRPTLTARDILHELDDYLPILATYDVTKLDAAALCQLVLAYDWKANKILSEPDLGEAKPAPTDEENTEPPDPAKVREAWESRRAKASEYTAAAVEAGKLPFLGESAATDDANLIRLARLVAPMARDQLGDSRLAGQIWVGASRKVSPDRLKGECELHAADLAINDMLNAGAGKTFLEAATAHLAQSSMEQTGPIPSRLQRVWGDYYAMTGDGEAARKAYLAAERILASPRSYIERTAWRGAHSRSTEEFLKNGEFDRAAAEIRAWQREFPADKIEGYMTLLCARYWAGREYYDQAVALSDQLLAVNPDSPYIDQLLLLAADCEVKRNRVDRALAILHSLLQDYPGSPLVPDARKKIHTLESGDKTGDKK